MLIQTEGFPLCDVSMVFCIMFWMARLGVYTFYSVRRVTLGLVVKVSQFLVSFQFQKFLFNCFLDLSVVLRCL